MITLQYSGTDAYGRYGVEHFVKRSGIPFTRTKQGPSTPNLHYARGTPGDFIISIHGNEIQNSLCGEVHSGDGTAPVCETPKDTGPGDRVIASFGSGIKKYPCITRHTNGIDIGIDIFQETGCILSGHLDRIWDSLAEKEKQELSSVPVVDFLEELLLSSIREGCFSQKIPLVFKSYWPDAKKFAVCLTHDVDEVKKTYQWITRPVKSMVSGDYRGLKAQGTSLLQKFRGKEPYNTFDDIIAIEKQFHASSTFFFLKETGKPGLLSPGTWNLYGRNHNYHNRRVRTAIQTVFDHGSEVAVHGSFYSFKDPGRILSETRDLENVLHGKVSGIRQHHLNLVIPDTWNYQSEAGLLYDSSLGYKDRLGFRWGTSFPFYPFNGKEELRIHELPLIIMDVCLFSRQDPLDACYSMSDQVEKFHGLLTILWHPPVFNSSEVPLARELYCNILKRAQERGALVTNARTIVKWENDRNGKDLACRWAGSTVVIEPSRPDGEYFISCDIPAGCRLTKVSGNATEICRDENPKDAGFTRIDIRALPNEQEKEIAVMMT